MVEMGKENSFAKRFHIYTGIRDHLISESGQTESERQNNFSKWL